MYQSGIAGHRWYDYLSLLRAKGLRETAIKSHQNTNYLGKTVAVARGRRRVPGPVFNEFVQQDCQWTPMNWLP